MLSAKYILVKFLGVVSIAVSVVYLVFPHLLLLLLGFDSMQFGQGQVLVDLIVRLAAFRGITMGIAMILASSKLTIQYWTWAFVASVFADALIVSSITTEFPLRHLIPVWGIAIVVLFFVGMAYGLDIAGVLQTESDGSDADQGREDSELVVKSESVE